MCDVPGLKRHLDESVGQLYRSDRQLIDGGAHEQAITARLAFYLAQRFSPQWDVDCEYNRDDRDERDIKRDQEGRAIRPDIIVHRRREPENLLAVELKPLWSRRSVRRDHEKLIDLTGERFGYRLGALVHLGKQQYQIDWYRDGLPEHETTSAVSRMVR